MKINLLIAGALMMGVTFTGCKKDDKDSSSTTTSTTSSTSTTSATTPNTLVYDGTTIQNVVGNCEYGSNFAVTGDVTTSDGAHYFLSVDFAVDAPPTGTYKTVELTNDPITSTQCHVQLQRTKGSFALSMLAPTGSSINVVKNGTKYSISFGTIKFNVKSGGNGTKSVSCSSVGC
jgi:hypothetical protein